MSYLVYSIDSWMEMDRFNKSEFYSILIDNKKKFRNCNLNWLQQRKQKKKIKTGKLGEQK